MRDRLDSIEYLLDELDINLKIFGTGWDSISVPSNIKNCFYGPALELDYARAINGAKICLGFLNREAYDEITTRSFEIPSSGGFLLAERTEQHSEILLEDVEAVFFSSKEELARKVKYYLNNSEERELIKERGYTKITKGDYSWESLIKDILIQINREK